MTLSAVLSNLVGAVVTVRARDKGDVPLTGLLAPETIDPKNLATADPFVYIDLGMEGEPTTAITKENCQRLLKQPRIRFPLSKLARLDAQVSPPPRNVNLGTFRTDTATSAQSTGSPNAPRVFQPWQAPTSSSSVHTSLSLESSSSARWNQFDVNRQLFGVKADFDEHAYTTRIDTKSPMYAQRLKDAARLAAEIEGGASKQRNAYHDAELVGDEAKQGVEEEDEELLYGSVQAQKNDVTKKDDNPLIKANNDGSLIKTKKDNPSIKPKDDTTKTDKKPKWNLKAAEYVPSTPITTAGWGGNDAYAATGYYGDYYYYGDNYEGGDYQQSQQQQYYYPQTSFGAFAPSYYPTTNYPNGNYPTSTYPNASYPASSYPTYGYNPTTYYPPPSNPAPSSNNPSSSSTRRDNK